MPQPGPRDAGSQDLSSAATCDHSGPRPTVLQAGQGRREGREPFVPPWDARTWAFPPPRAGPAPLLGGGHPSLAAARISDTGGRRRPQMGCAGADVSHLAEQTALGRMDNTVLTQIGDVQSAIHI